jgi:hypothetical protein
MKVTTGLLNETTQGVLNILNGSSNELFLKKIDASTWSLAEIVEHIILVEEGIVFNLNRLGNSGETITIENLMTHDFIMEKCLQRVTKVDAPKMFVPTGKFTEIKEAVDAFTAHRKKVTVFYETNTFDLSSIGFPHPRLGMMNGDNWLSFIPGHCQRHTDQMNIVMAELTA